MLESFFRSWSKPILFLAIAFLPFSLWATHVAINSARNEVDDWLPSKFAEIRELRWFQESFKSDEILIVSWDGCDMDDVRLDRLAFHAQRAVDPQGRPLFFRSLTGRSIWNELDRAESGLSEEEKIDVLRGWILGANRQTCALFMVDPSIPSNRRLAVAEIQRIAEQHCSLALSDLKIGGPTADSVFVDQISVRSLRLLSAVSIVVGALMAFLFLKNLTMTFATFATAVLAELGVLTMIYVSGSNLDIVLTIVPSLVYILTICAAIHFLNAYREESYSDLQPALSALKKTWKPTLLAAVTTALGLASLMVSELIPIRRFGLFGSLGVSISAPMLLVFLTAFFTVFPIRFRPTQPNRNENSFGRFDLAVSHLAMRHPRVIVVVSLVMMLLFGCGAVQIKTSAKARDLFAKGSHELKDYRWLEDNIGSIVPMEVVIVFGEKDTSTMLERLTFVDRVRQRISEVPHVTGVTSAASFMRHISTTGGMRSTVQRAVANKKLLAQRDRFIQEGLIATRPTEELWLISGRVPIFIDGDYGLLLEEIEKKVDTCLADYAHGTNADCRSVVTGGVPVFDSVQKRLMVDLKASLAGSLLTIGGLLAFFLWNIRAALLLLIPNTLPAVFIFGIMGWLNVTVDLGCMLTISTALGIAVDNEMHFISYFRQRLLDSSSREAALKKTLEHCGSPILYSTLICSLGMLVFTLSSFGPTVRFGFLMSALIVAAFFGDVLVLPALLQDRLSHTFFRASSRISD